MKKSLVVLAFLGLASSAEAQAPVAEMRTYDISDLYFRDPFIMPVSKEKTYYMYRSASKRDESGREIGGVEVFKSQDLKSWVGPKQVCVLPEGNWSRGGIWAPEVHEYKGKYYLFATINSDVSWKKSVKGWPDYIWRGTQVLVSKSPEGPFLPMTDTQTTPIDEMALDGTLWVEGGKPYMIYCHEWVQVVDGEMCLLPLSDDLSHAVGPSVTLFNASAAPWSTGLDNGQDKPRSYVTDGCFLYRTKTGQLLMIWSSFCKGQYAIGIAESASGRVTGPWRQQTQPLFDENGGHAMIFRRFDGQPCIVLHQPNSPAGAERAHIYELEDCGNTLKILGELRQ